ncbi:MAG TPA: phosphate ABC transporter permease subunit PstC [Pseudonocardiaceae bacterium]|nr:phosphate ABC transporter permease subunit PstC [Pseudonocardiaceae bacterium]
MTVPADGEVARPIRSSIPPGDRLFRGAARAGGLLVLLIMGGIGVFLAIKAAPALKVYGWTFFTQHQWASPDIHKVGIASVALGSVLVALVAIVVSFPLAMLTALYICEYAPRRLRQTFVTVIDLMAAVPSVVYGLWGFSVLESAVPNFSRWLQTYLPFIPIFQVNADPHAAIWDEPSYEKSIFLCGLTVSMMVIPIACSVMREVFFQAPTGEREAALALGGTRWGMIRRVVLPFGRGGIVGGTMLGLGRALGETIAVSLIISPTFEISSHLTQRGGDTISALIALQFGDAKGARLSALMAAGLVLFGITLVVNLIAGVIVARSRSGAATEI